MWGCTTKIEWWVKQINSIWIFERSLISFEKLTDHNVFSEKKSGFGVSEFIAGSREQNTNWASASFDVYNIFKAN